jgi:ribosomal protein S25
VTGPRGFGKTNLIDFILAIAEHKKLTQIIENQDVKRDLDSFAGGYTPIRLIDDARDVEQVIRRLEKHEPLGERKHEAMTDPNKELGHFLERYKKEHPEKQIIIYKEIETPEEVAKNIETMKILCQYPLKTIIETNNESVAEELVGQLPNTAIIKLE